MTGILGDAPPQQGQNLAGAMVAVNGGPSQLQHFAADACEGGKVKLLLTVVTEIMRGGLAGLHSISTDNLAAGPVFDDQMDTEQIEVILVETGGVRGFQTFSQFDVKDFEP